MSALYVMPGPLGGQELELIRANDDGWDFLRWPLAPNLSAELRLPAGLAKPVKPPLPEEPPVGTFVACGADGNLLPFYRRWDEGWSQVGGGVSSTWSGICDESQERAERWPVVMVPDPFAEPVALPWKRQIGEFPTMAHVEPIDKGVGLALDSGGRRISPDLSLDEARELGCALMTAADAAEKEQS